MDFRIQKSQSEKGKILFFVEKLIVKDWLFFKTKNWVNLYDDERAVFECLESSKVAIDFYQSAKRFVVYEHLNIVLEKDKDNDYK